MQHSREKMSRGEALKGIIILPALAATVALPLQAEAAKQSKPAMKYQNKPKGS
ncbi:MAG: hypothetical protein JO018_01960, partial [Candidatus Eremiobacteraeota bacterium]|nr:hypothetical protein [Candidatus Eremiobacteraeota bacterium]